MPVGDSFSDLMSNHRYMLFRNQYKQQQYDLNGGQVIISNPKMRRNAHPPKPFPKFEVDQYDEQSQRSTPDQQMRADGTAATEAYNMSGSDSSSSGVNNGQSMVKDNAYYERRRKNNAAAKKSRDRRRLKEDELAIRANFLERENISLKVELHSVKRQLAAFMKW